MEDTDNTAQVIMELTKKFDQAKRKLDSAMNEYKEEKDKEDEDPEALLDDL